MQSKGSLGSIVAGVIAIFLVLVCLFYISFSVVTNHYEGKAEEYAAAVGQGNETDSIKAYNQYIDSIGKEPVYLGYTFNDVQKWGVGLGLDLKGGMNVILQVSVPDILASMHNNPVEGAFTKAIATTDSIVGKGGADDYVGTFIKQYRQNEPTADFSVKFRSIAQGSDDNAVINKLKNEVNDVVNNSATNVLRKRIDQYGVVSPNIQVLQGKDGQILLELPGVKDHQRVRDLLQRSANLGFYETYTMLDIQNSLGQLDAALRADTLYNGKGLFDYFMQINQGAATPQVGLASSYQRDKIDELLASDYAKRYLKSDLLLRWEVKPTVFQFNDTVTNAQKDIELYGLIALKSLNGKAALDGDCVVEASSEYDTFQGNVVSMVMDNEGASKWYRLTDANKGKSIAILLDNYVYSYPNVNDAIAGGRSQITGNFTIEEAQDLANVLKSGKMTARVDIISDMVIGPSLGQQAIDAGFNSFIIALVLLMIFMVAIYGFIPGLIANFAVLCNLFFTFGILSSFQAVLTLSGIAGIVLAMGMAVDANVLIYERAKEELRAGKNARTAIADGYSNAFSAIFDANLTSIITGVILLLYGTGPIKGFATTLIIGIVCSFFTAVFLSRLFFIWGGKTKAFQKLTFTTALSRNFLTDTKVNFIGQRKISFAVVGVIIAVMVGSLFMRGLNQGIDFSGGRNYVVKFDQPVNTVDIQERLSEQFPNSTVSVITIEDKDQIRISTNYKINDDAPEVEEEIVNVLYKTLEPELNGLVYEQFTTADENHGIISSQKVGPTVADDMRTGAYIAVVLSLIAMFLYILIRFRNVAFSLGALAAVAFTAFAIIGVYSLCWGILPFAMEIDQTFIAAILTVIGYQINDTVVVFDRVRENVSLFPKQDFFTTLNKSINSTLTRTLMTSLSTLLVLLVIFVLGGDSIRSFVFAMIVGVIVGTLATIYVASPVAYITDKRRANKK